MNLAAGTVSEPAIAVVMRPVPHRLSARR